MARKRSLSPTSALSAKRLRTTSATHPARATPLTLDARSLSDELFLSILVYLSPYDLSAVERVDRHFLRLANDPILWRSELSRSRLAAPELTIERILTRTPLPSATRQICSSTRIQSKLPN